MTANPDFDAEKARLHLAIKACHDLGLAAATDNRDVLFKFASDLAALSRPAGDVGKLVAWLTEQAEGSEQAAEAEGIICEAYQPQLKVWDDWKVGDPPHDAKIIRQIRVALDARSNSDRFSKDAKNYREAAAALAALSRPAGDVGKLVEEARQLAGWLVGVDGYDKVSEFIMRLADALTALSSAPVDAGVEELAQWNETKAANFKGLTLYVETEARHRESAAMLRALSRQLATERQAWAKVRAEIEALCNPDPDPDGSLPSDEYLRAANGALAILAQHTPQAGKEG